MLIETETTPNPRTLKFLPGEAVMTAGTRDFATPEEAEASPLAAALFSTGDVEGVFFGRDFVSVTAAPGVGWPDLKPRVLEVLLDHFASGAPLFAPGANGASAQAIHIDDDLLADDDAASDPETADVVAQIRDLIDTRVRPAVANDGGDIVYRGFRDGTVFLRLQGAGSGCPSSSMTLKNGIEQLLRHYVPEVSAVEAV